MSDNFTNTSSKFKQASVYLDQDLAEFVYRTAHELRQTESQYIRSLINNARIQYRQLLIERAKRS